MSANFNPSDFGITTDVSVENLVNAFQQYEKYVASLKGDTVKAEAPKLEDEKDQEAADEFVSTLRHSLFSILDSNPILSLVLVDSLKGITKDVREFRDWFLADQDRKGIVVPVDDDSKAVAKALKETIEMLYGAGNFLKVKDSEGNMVTVNSLLPETFKLKTNKAGERLPDLSRAPYEKGATSKKVGGYTLRYRWYPSAILDSDGNWETDSDGSSIGDEPIEIPAGTFTDEIAMRYVSTPDYRVERSQVFDSLPHTEHQTPSGQTRRRLAMPNDGSSVFVQFDSGVLEAWLPVGTEQEETEEETDDDDDAQVGESSNNSNAETE